MRSSLILSSRNTHNLTHSREVRIQAQCKLLLTLIYLEVQSSYKRRKMANYSCHKLWGLSDVIPLTLKTFYSLSFSTVPEPIDLTLCNSYILQFFFVCNLTVHPSRLLLCSWLKKRIDILYKHFNPHPDWSRRKSCSQKHVRSAACICMYGKHSLTQIYLTYLSIFKAWFIDFKHLQSRQICKSWGYFLFCSIHF